MMIDIASLPRSAVEYTKTVHFPGSHINAAHRDLLEAPLQEGGVKIAHEVRGSLRRADAGKIYELAYYAGGDTIDIGTNWGLSACIAASALRDAGNGFSVSTIDLDPKMTKRGESAFAAMQLENVSAYTGDGADILRRWASEGRVFRFAFVDHSHAYDPMKDVCEQLGAVMAVGSYVAFHDFLDKRNIDDSDPGFQVPQAIRDGLPKSFAYVGASGCTGVFIKT